MLAARRRPVRAACPDIGRGSTAVEPTARLRPTSRPASRRAPARCVMRRLTYREYDHMMTQLLGDTTSPASGANGWSPDAPALTGFVAPGPNRCRQLSRRRIQPDGIHPRRQGDQGAGGRAEDGQVRATSGLHGADGAQESSCATKFVTAFGLAGVPPPGVAAKSRPT